jgi:hypothetical protein
MLRTLKQQYEPSEQELDYGALRKYENARTQPIRQGKISGWLNNFEKAYLIIKHCNLPESNDKHVKQQFLAAISAVSYSYADRYLDMMNDLTYQKEDFQALLGNY